MNRQEAIESASRWLKTERTKDEESYLSAT